MGDQGLLVLMQLNFLMMIRQKIVLLFQHFRALYHYQKFYDEIAVGIGHPI